MASLNVWMNGELVGEWTTLRTGAPVFRYAKTWSESRHARALSLSLPLTADLQLRGPEVENYFDNLLPDSVDIRRRIRNRFHLRSTEAFDLLTALGRDCVGAVQLLPPDTEPDGWNRVAGAPASEADIQRVLNQVTSPVPIGHADDATAEEFRVSLAGAQEKTALLSMGGQWFLPRGATPTTHILKLPLGRIGGFGGDFFDSVENEWLCARLLREFGLPVAETEIATFGKQKALVVTRFDRRWIGVDADAARKRGFVPAQKVWIARLPQEDLCQATGRASSRKYQADGGPSIDDGLLVLGGSENADADKTQFVLAQLVFWLLAATDGHGKNFSIHHLPGGTYRMTPLYDVLSVWPITGPGANQLAIQKVKLAMAVRSGGRHYRVREIQRRHWHALARQAGAPGLWERMCALVESAGPALERVEKKLPRDFPERTFAKIRDGVLAQARGFLATGE